MRKPRKPQSNWTYGYIVKIGPVRSGGADNCYVCDDNKRKGFSGAVGIGGLQDAMFFTGDKDENGQTAAQRAAAYAFWQLGDVWFARRDETTQRIESLYPC